MYYCYIRPTDGTNEWLCESQLMLEPGAEVDFERHPGVEDDPRVRGIVLSCSFIYENLDTMLRQVWGKAPVGVVVARYFRSEWGFKAEPDPEPKGIDPLSLFTPEDELEAAPAEEVLGANE